MNLSGKNIVHIISGSIAAYKSADLLRELMRQGHSVEIIMTNGAAKFITPLTIQSLLGKRVHRDLFSEEEEAGIGHIELADLADLVLVAPATADIMARVAVGRADDLATSVLLATKAPRLFAPAMNVNMWNNPLTQRNVRTLLDVGCAVLDPDEGELACGWVGQGRFPDVGAIVQKIEEVLTPADLAGIHVVVTAGPTREALDPIRFISNRSSGRMGFALAKAAQRRGATVTLISGPVSLATPPGVRRLNVVTASEMHEALFDTLRNPPAETDEQMLFMAAAVCDHRPSSVSPQKLKHAKDCGHEIAMSPNVDILAQVGAEREGLQQQSNRQLRIIGFAAETGGDNEIVSSAIEKLRVKGADFIVANNAEALESTTNRVLIVGPGERVLTIGPGEKVFLADEIFNVVLDTES